MTFNDDAQLDTSQISGGSGGGGGRRPGGLVVGGGGGILGLVILVLFMFLGGGNGTGGTGGTTSPFDTSQVAGAGANASTDLFANCKTGADANRDVNCRIVGTVNSVQSYWTTNLPKLTNNQRTWRATTTVLYSGTTASACGTASNQVGPFYCPLDRKVYIDASFFGVLDEQFGGTTGALAQEYVVAHEYGHALQDQLALLDEAQKDPKGPESGGVRIELMADCFAGMWVKGASSTTDAHGATLLKEPTAAQVQDALNAASTVGDDNIMKKTQGRVSPENFSHGTSAQRMRWFSTGYKATALSQCNTLDATTL